LTGCVVKIPERKKMKELVVKFEVLGEDQAYRHQGTAYADVELLVVKTGRGEFDVLSKISNWYTDAVIAEIMAGGHQ